VQTIFFATSQNNNKTTIEKQQTRTKVKLYEKQEQKISNNGKE
jgi:hypothetical protein